MRLRISLVVGILLCATIPGLAFEPLFDVRIDYPVGKGSYGLCTEDFDGDGYIDLAVTCYYSKDVSILRSNGDGTFQEAVSLPVGLYPSGAVAADIESDGDPDLIINRSYSRTVIICINDAGVFQVVDSIILEKRLGSIVCEDFDGDGDLDLAVSQYYCDIDGSCDTSYVTLLFNDGSGAFVRGFDINMGLGSTHLTAIDSDGDGDMDLAARLRLPGWFFAPIELYMLINDGSGHFESSFRGEVAYGAGWAVDWDHDDDFDLAFGWRYGLVVYLNDGFGQFGDSIFCTEGGLDIDDVDNDGQYEWISASGNSISISRPNSSSECEVLQSIDIGFYVDGLLSEDIDGDGFKDFVCDSDSTDRITVIYNDGSGNFSVPSPPTYPTGVYPHSIESADFDRDGDIDLVVANLSSSNIMVYLNDGRGGFGDVETYDAGRRPWSVTTGDLNRDGYLDIAIGDGDSDSITVLLNMRNGTFYFERQMKMKTGRICLAAAHLNSDYAADLAVLRQKRSQDPGIVTISVLLNLGSSLFTRRELVAGREPSALCATDFGGDGDIDLAVVHSGEASVKIFENNGDWSFQSASTYSLTANAYAVDAADLNGDTWPDLVIGNRSAVGMSVLRNDGQGGFADVESYDYVSHMRSTVLADFDLDADVDIAGISITSNVVTVCQNNGSGDFHGRTDYGVGSHPVDAVAGDFDGDGDPDLAVINSGSDEVAILFNLSGVVTAVEDDRLLDLPRQIELSQNYPNPFNPATTIEYTLIERSHVTIEVFNVLGQRVRTLVDEEQPAGAHTLAWDGKSATGQSVSTGVYLYRFRAGKFVETRKMLLLK